MDDASEIEIGTDAETATALNKFTVRVHGYIPVYRFVREDEDQTFDCFLDPFTREMNIAPHTGALDAQALQAIAGYAEKAKREAMNTDGD